VEELTRIVWGIRLLNREAKRGGAGVPDVPGDVAATPGGRPAGGGSASVRFSLANDRSVKSASNQTYGLMSRSVDGLMV